MNRSDMVSVEKYFEAFIIIFLISLSILLIKDYLLSILFASSLVFLVYKPYTILLKKTKKDFLSAFIMTSLVLLILFLPIYFVSFSLVTEGFQIYESSENLISEFNFDNCSYDFCSTLRSNIVFFQAKLNNLATEGFDYLSSQIGVVLNSITSFILNIAIFTLSLFFFLKDGEKFMRYVKRIVPMKNEYKDALFLRFRQVSTAVFVDSIFVAIIQGFLTGIGLYFTGFSSPIFWSIIASFLALLPLIGSALVWIPASIYLFLTSNYVLGIGLLLYGFFIISLSDNILRPILMHHRIPIHSFLIFLSILGGMSVFGFIGLFLGPIIISLLVSVLQLYKLDFK